MSDRSQRPDVLEGISVQPERSKVRREWGFTFCPFKQHFGDLLYSPPTGADPFTDETGALEPPTHERVQHVHNTIVWMQAPDRHTHSTPIPGTMSLKTLRSTPRWSDHTGSTLARGSNETATKQRSRHLGWRAPPEAIFFLACPLATIEPRPNRSKNGCRRAA